MEGDVPPDSRHPGTGGPDRTDAAGGDRHPTLRALALPPLRRFVAARFFSTTAHSMLAATISWHVFELTRSSFQLGVLGMVKFLPVLPASLLAGAVADSRDRRGVLVAAQLAALLGATLLSIASAAGAGVTWVFALAFALAVAWAFESPAGSALLPSLVPEAIFPNAVVISAASRNLGFVGGPVLTGFAVERAGVGAAYLLSATLLALSVAALLTFRPPPPTGARGRVTLAAIREGVSFVRRRPVILGSMTLDMFAVIFAGATALLPVYATQILAVGPRGFGLLSAAISIGTFLMTGILLALRGFERPGRTLLLSVACFGLATIAFGVSRSFPVSMLALVVAGMADQVSMTTRATIIQLATPDALRGRVNSVNMVFIGASNELGEAESGFLAALTSATFAVVFGGLACLATVGCVARLAPELARHRIGATAEPAHRRTS